MKNLFTYFNRESELSCYSFGINKQTKWFKLQWELSSFNIAVSFFLIGVYSTLANKKVKANQIPQPNNSQSNAVNESGYCYGITTAAGWQWRCGNKWRFLWQYVISTFSYNITSLLHVPSKMLHKGGRRSWCSSISFTLGVWHWPQHLQEAQVGDIRLGIECSPCGQCLSGPASAGQRLSQHQAFCNSHSANPAVLHSMCMCRWPPSILSATGFRPGTSFRHHNIWTHVVHT